MASLLLNEPFELGSLVRGRVLHACVRHNGTISETCVCASIPFTVRQSLLVKLVSLLRFAFVSITCPCRCSSDGLVHFGSLVT